MTATAPHPYDVLIDGHGYMIDQASEDWRHETIPLLRPSFIASDRVGENELNPEAGLRFSDIDWSHGAGQRRADLPASDTSRFWKSRGVDVWTKWQVSLLPEFTLQSSGPFDANGLFYVSGDLYIWGNLGLAYGFPANPTVNVVEAGAVFGACTDGENVYFSDSLTVEVAAAGSTSHSTYNTVGGVGSLFYVSGRLLGLSSSNGHILDIQNPTYDDLGHLPGTYTAVDMTDAVNAIYILAVSGDLTRTQVFSITIAEDGTTLNPAVAVTPPFDGQGRRIFCYEGLVFIGMANGLRMAVTDANASLTVGPLIETGNCSAFLGHNGKVWFGWDNYELDDSGTTYWTGFGRLDPSVINDTGAPAYAADVMASGFAHSSTPIVLDVTTDLGLLVALAAGGVYVARLDPTSTGTIGNRVPSGYVRSGLISFDLPDDKSARYVTVVADATSSGTITPSYAVDGSETFTNLDVLAAGETRERVAVPDSPTAGAFELKMTLARDVSPTTAGAVLTRTMLQAEPVVDSGEFIYVPLLLANPVQGADQQDKDLDPAAEREFLFGLRTGGSVVTYNELGEEFQVTVEDVQWKGHHVTGQRDTNGTCVLKLKTV